MAEEGHTVVLNVYDLSQGLARQLSSTFLGKAIEGIWHTGIVVYGHEYYFGGGIQCAPAGSTPYGTPIRAVELGVTHVPKDVFEMYLEEIRPRYTVETYSLLTHNCNNFSNEVAQFLVGATIPEHILNLPNEVMSSPMGSLMLPMMQNLETILKAGAVPQPPQFKPQSVAQPTQPVVSADMSKPAKSNSNSRIGQSNIRKSDDEFKSETESARPGEQKTSEISVPPIVKPANMSEKSTSGVVDPFGDARSKVQEEITKEFAAIMATGTLRASEAAALATRRVMQRHGHMNAAMPRC